MIDRGIPEGYIISKYSENFEKFVGTKLFEYLHKDELIYGFCTSESRHQNQGGSIHGGVLMTAMDHILAMHILRQKNPPSRIATIQLNSNFIARGIPGYFVIAKPKIVKKTRDVIFVDGSLFHGQMKFYTASGIWKIIRSSS